MHIGDSEAYTGKIKSSSQQCVLCCVSWNLIQCSGFKKLICQNSAVQVSDSFQVEYLLSVEHGSTSQASCMVEEGITEMVLYSK